MPAIVISNGLAKHDLRRSGDVVECDPSPDGIALLGGEG